MEYSAVSQPPLTPCWRIHEGTFGSMVAAQMIRVWPKLTRTEPDAYGAMFASNVTGRSCDALRLSERGMRLVMARKRWSYGDGASVGACSQGRQPGSVTPASARPATIRRAQDVRKRWSRPCKYWIFRLGHEGGGGR